MFDSNIEYIITATGGGWCYAHTAYAVTSNNHLYILSKWDETFDNVEITKEYDINFKPMHKCTSYDENGRKEIYIECPLKDGKPDFDKSTNKVQCCMDSPEYTLYRVKNCSMKKMIVTEVAENYPAMDYMLYYKED